MATGYARLNINTMSITQPNTLIKGLKKIKPLYLLMLCLLSAIICIFALRSNDQNMSILLNNVYTADRQNGNVELALDQLRTYVYSHMNTSLASGPNAVYPPIQLKYTYGRLQQSEQQQVDAANATIYTNAQAYCQQLNPVSFSGRTRVPCIEAYVQSHGSTVQPIPAGLYEFDFISPTWSPDLAGWSLMASVLFFFGFIVSYVVKRLHKYHRN